MILSNCIMKVIKDNIVTNACVQVKHVNEQT